MPCSHRSTPGMGRRTISTVPIGYTVDREQRRLVAQAAGHLGLADIEGYQRAKEDDFAQGYDELIDARAATTSLTADEVASLVDHFREPIQSARFGRIAVVIADEHLLRLVAMFSSLVLPLGMMIQVFRETDLAEEWLNAEAADGSDIPLSPQSGTSAPPPTWTCPHCGHTDWLRNKQCPKCGRFENEPRVTRPPR